MRSILTASGAVIQIDPKSTHQSRMLNVAATAFGGIVAEIEAEQEVSA